MEDAPFEAACPARVDPVPQAPLHTFQVVPADELEEFGFAGLVFPIGKNRTRAAEVPGISRRALYAKLIRYGL